MNWLGFKFLLIVLVSVLFECLGGHCFLLAQQVRVDTLVTRKNAVRPVDEKQPVKVKSPKGAVLRSLVVPGWGQWYNEKKWKALLVLGTETGFIGAAIWHNQRVVTPLDESTGVYTEEYKEQYKNFHINMRNQYVWYLAGAILFSLADAYVDAHLFNFDESIDLSFRTIGVSGAESQFAVGLKLSKTF